MNRREFTVGGAAAVAALGIIPTLSADGVALQSMAHPVADFTTDNLLVKAWERHTFYRSSDLGVFIEEWRMFRGADRQVVIYFEDGSRLVMPDPAAEIFERIRIKRRLGWEPSKASLEQTEIEVKDGQPGGLRLRRGG